MVKQLLNLKGNNTVYAIIFAYIYFHGFGLGSEICEGLISRFSDAFFTLNRHKLKWKFSRGLTRENKTTAKITTFTVYSYLCLLKSNPLGLKKA